jgi:hypothetical protein
MAETILGFAGLTYAGSRVTYDPYRGVTKEDVYEGPQDACVAGYNSLDGQTVYRELDLTTKNPVGRLIIRTPDYNDGGSTSLVITTWELNNNPSTVSGYEHSKAQLLGASTINDIKKTIKGNRTMPTDLSASAQTLYEHMIRGEDVFFHAQSTFKVTHLVSRRGTVAVSFANVERVYTSAGVITETLASTLYADAIVAAFANYPLSTPSGHTKGWLKQSPTYSNVAGQRVAVSIEYYLGTWSDYYYGD